MATIPAGQTIIAAPARSRVSRSREQTTFFVYMVACAVGLIPTIMGSSPAWQAAGLGLWFPGAGFLALGPLGALATLLSLVLFAVSLVAWFGSGMVIAPVLIWGLSTLFAALAAPAAPWVPAPYLVAGLTIAGVAYSRFRSAKQDASDVRQRDVRNAFLPGAIQALRTERSAPPEPGSRELDMSQLQHMRYIYDRALQPIDKFEGFDKVDQFQTAATRYQINAASYVLGMAQCHYTPNFHGYASLAQRNLIEKYLQKPVWSYWIYESMWGHLNFSNHDPVGKDNIMLTGFFGIQVGLYMSNTGDRRYLEEGSLTFQRGDGSGYSHRYPDMSASIAENFRKSAFCLYPCEPNWIYPICNHYGMTAMTLDDRLTGARNVNAVLPTWLNMLDTELSDKKGTPVPLRSSLTGWKPPFPATDAMYVPFANCFLPERAERLWATARTEMQPLLVSGGDPTRLTLPGAGVDFGNYRKGHGMNYAQFGNAAREMGDDEFADAAERALEADAGLETVDGVSRYMRMSNLGNCYGVMSKIQRRDDFRIAVCEGPGAAALTGPILSEAIYPDVLVAKAFSRGDDLEIVLFPGRRPGSQEIGIERLTPAGTYHVDGVAGGPLMADAQGKLRLRVDLQGRTALHLRPAA